MRTARTAVARTIGLDVSSLVEACGPAASHRLVGTTLDKVLEEVNEKGMYTAMVHFPLTQVSAHENAVGHIRMGLRPGRIMLTTTNRRAFPDRDGWYLEDWIFEYRRD